MPAIEHTYCQHAHIRSHVLLKKIHAFYSPFHAVQAELRRAGLESSNLIVAIDYTKVNPLGREGHVSMSMLKWTFSWLGMTSS
eukprot:440628-Pelagomonas_calceolata.AAC.1